MAYYKWIIKKYSRLDVGVWDTTNPEILTNFNSVRVIRSAGKKKDTFEFKMRNLNDSFFTGDGSIVQSGDRIQIHNLVNETTATADNFIIEGIVTKISRDETSSGDTVRIAGMSRSEIVFNALILVDAEAIPKTSVEIIQDCLDAITNYNTMSGLTLTWTTKPDDTGWETHSTKAINQPAKVIVDKFSMNEYTGNGNYLWYIDENNDFIWVQKGTTTTGNITEGIDDINKVSTKFKTDQLVNLVVVNCGYDPDNNSITAYVFDYGSIARNGAKWKILTPTRSLSRTLLDGERTNKSSDWEAGNTYPKSGSYPYTTFWTSSGNSDDTPACTLGNSVVCSNDDNFKRAIVREVRWRGVKEGQGVIDLYANPRYSFNIQLPRNNTYTLGAKYNVILSSMNFNKPLRIEKITFDDWNTSLELIQDEQDANDGTDT
tara:strand:+ start:2091 stop:3383 length:1293 start_codon:yes stop_codon:yes gene_type:complete